MLCKASSQFFVLLDQSIPMPIVHCMVLLPWLCLGHSSFLMKHAKQILPCLIPLNFSGFPYFHLEWGTHYTLLVPSGFQILYSFWREFLAPLFRCRFLWQSHLCWREIQIRRILLPRCNLFCGEHIQYICQQWHRRRHSIRHCHEWECRVDMNSRHIWTLSPINAMNRETVSYSCPRSTTNDHLLANVDWILCKTFGRTCISLFVLQRNLTIRVFFHANQCEDSQQSHLLILHIYLVRNYMNFVCAISTYSVQFCDVFVCVFESILFATLLRLHRMNEQFDFRILQLF